MSKENGRIKVTEIRTYVPLSHHYADLLANMAASIELCSSVIELWEVWQKELKDKNSKQLVERMLIITTRYLNNPQGRAFSLFQHTNKREFYEISEKIQAIKEMLEKFQIDHNQKELLDIKNKLNQMAENFRLEIQLLAKSEIVEYTL
ncbi:MAG: hypothetical protein NWE98_08335 [Candidatus Bathyarchaeota archaeon]|nr:hypothetical protein [Candidatus Bathyarchaeota archaeon]